MEHTLGPSLAITLPIMIISSLKARYNLHRKLTCFAGYAYELNVGKNKALALQCKVLNPRATIRPSHKSIFSRKQYLSGQFSGASGDTRIRIVATYAAKFNS